MRQCTEKKQNKQPTLKITLKFNETKADYEQQQV